MRSEYEANVALAASKRVTYVNQIDGKRRVLIGRIDAQTAEAVMVRFGNRKAPAYYMGPGMRIEDCDGTDDGAIIP